MSNFITRNKPDWEELERLLSRARKSRARLTPAELSRIDVLYRRTTIHLSQVATRTRDEKLLLYLNNLVAAAHSLIYLPPRQSMFAGAIQFVANGFARSVARTWRYHAVAALLVLGGAIFAYFASLHDPVIAYALLPPGEMRLPGSTTDQLEEILRSGRDTGGGEKSFFASFLFTHNVKVGIMAMGAGVLAAAPTVILLLYNGMLLGAFMAVHSRAGIYGEVWAWILPHGITEIGAIILCGGIGLLLGRSVISPGLLTRMESLRQAGVEAARVAMGIALMLLAAAGIESFLRQSHLTTPQRLLFAAGSAIFWLIYFGNGFLLERSAVATASAEDPFEDLPPGPQVEMTPAR